MNQPIQEAHRVRMGAMSISFHQDSDSCSNDDQMLTVSIDDAGGGSFFVLTADRWSINSAEELADLLNEVKSRLGDWWVTE